MINDFDEKLLHQIIAALDIMVNPSVYYPLPMIYYIAMKYFVIPVVSFVLGITHGVQPFNRISKKGNGFIFHEDNSISILGKVISSINAISYDNFQSVLQENMIVSDLKSEKSIEDILKVYNIILK